MTIPPDDATRALVPWMIEVYPGDESTVSDQDRWAMAQGAATAVYPIIRTGVLREVVEALRVEAEREGDEGFELLSAANFIARKLGG